MRTTKNITAGLCAFAVAAAIWIPCLHFVFIQHVATCSDTKGLSPQARQLAARHLYLWTDPESRQQELGRMRASNAEWDFMGRTFLVWSLAEMSVRNPGGKPEYLKTMDQIIGETLQLERERG